MNPFKKDPQTEQDTQGPIRYPDASALRRPFGPPKYVILTCLAGALAAAALAWFFMGDVLDEVLHGEERKQAQIEENLNRDISYRLVPIDTFVPMSDGEIRTYLEENGLTYYEEPVEPVMVENDEGELVESYPETEGVDLFVIPEDVSLEVVQEEFPYGIDYGISGLNGTKASQILVGSWRIVYDRGDYTSVAIKYCDFSSTDGESAVNAAITAMGWAENETFVETEAGVDSWGNTYRQGNIEIDGKTYSWKVSACNLNNAFDIKGLPEDAQYVGIRITA